MRHRMAGYKLGRTMAHRKATLRNMAAGLFEHGQITTTVPRAKALQPFVEKIITMAKRDDLHSRRLVISKMGGNRNAFTWLHLPQDAPETARQGRERAIERASEYFNLPDEDSVKRNRYGELKKAPKLVKHIFEEVAPRYADRPGGYTRIVKLGEHRKGDGGDLCVLQLVGEEDGPEIGGRVSTRRRIADRRTARAAEVRKGFAKKAPAKAEAEAAAEAPAEEGGED